MEGITVVTKGTRLSEDWQLPEDWKNWAIAQRPDLHVLQIAEEFKDYWISKTGQGGTKLNWLATWRNWIRRQKDYRKPESKPISHQKYEAKPISKQEWQSSKEIAKKHMDELKRALR